MRDSRLTIVSAILVTGLFLNPAARSQTAQEKPGSMSFFDVLDMPVRIDEPKLLKVNDRYVLNCAIANRSTEPLLGLRLILMIVGSDGKMRKRVNWSEESALAPASINTFELRPPLSDKDRLQNTDRLLVAIDEAIGRETIWRLVDSEKALRAYARGQHDVIPKVRTVANNDDRIGPPRVIPLKMKP
jgi:hypothetical protein